MADEAEAVALKQNAEHLLEKAERERDEARAEVERLRAALGEKP